MATCPKIFLIIVNILFAIIGLGFIAGGIFVSVGENHYKDELDKLQKNIPEIASGVGLSVDEKKSKDASFDIGGVMKTAQICLLVLGCFITVTAILGMIGCCCVQKTKFLLVLYVIIVGVIVLAQIAIVLYLSILDIKARIKDEMRKMIKEKYGGIDSYNVESLSLNYIMLDYKCCGVEDYKDFDLAKNWESTRTLEIEGTEASYEMVTPIACCATKGKFPKLEMKSANCTINPNNRISNYKTGCLDELAKDARSNGVIIIAVFASIVVFEILCLVAAIFILCKTDNDGTMV